MPELLRTAFQASHIDVSMRVPGVAPYVPLPSGWEAYLAALPASRRYLVRRTLRDLENWAGGTLRLQRATDRSSLEYGQRVLIGLHGKRWAARRPGGAF